MFHYRHLIPVLLAATAHAEQLTLEAKPFFIAHSFRGNRPSCRERPHQA